MSSQLPVARFGLPRLAAWLLTMACACSATQAAERAAVVLRGTGPTEAAPHGQGNVYAPEVHRHEDAWWMWYGGQGEDGHDRIHLATSSDGIAWQRQGVVIDCGSANHVNDPTVTRRDDAWWMFYTVAQQGEQDQIAAARSTNGRQWELLGVVLPTGAADRWDSAKVGRPSVLWDQDRFRLWYDGQPTESTARSNNDASATRRVGRAVGYAESLDGRQWNRHERPVWIQGAGAVQVLKSAVGYLMVYESHQGTRYAKSGDGLEWADGGPLLQATGPDEAHGHVTPFFWLDKPDATEGVLFFGAASRATWNFNAIARVPITVPEN